MKILTNEELEALDLDYSEAIEIAESHHEANDEIKRQAAALSLADDELCRLRSHIRMIGKLLNAETLVNLPGPQSDELKPSQPREWTNLEEPVKKVNPYEAAQKKLRDKS